MAVASSFSDVVGWAGWVNSPVWMIEEPDESSFFLVAPEFISEVSFLGSGFTEQPWGKAC